MNAAESRSESDIFGFFNYCACFIDLLGQRDALRGQSLLHLISRDGDRAKFVEAVKPIIGPILALQKRTNQMVQTIVQPRPESPKRADLPPELHAEWDAMQQTRITNQFWSDGLVAFVSLGDREVKCPMNGIFGLFGVVGSECLIGLGSGAPIRGAIDVAWGVQLRPGELYGAVIARAYELESQYAQYPRIVVSSETVGYLQAQCATTDQDNLSQYNRALAQICMTMLLRDIDGLTILHYLGDSFRDNVSRDQHIPMYNDAKQFVLDQYTLHRKAANSKLAFRYHQLLHYFENHAPSPT